MSQDNEEATEEIRRAFWHAQFVAVLGPRPAADDVFANRVYDYKQSITRSVLCGNRVTETERRILSRIAEDADFWFRLETCRKVLDP